MTGTEQPRKQRTEAREAPLHERQKQVRAPLTGDLREEHGQRSVRVNAGDTVEVLRGDFAGTEGEVQEVDLRNATIHVEEVTLERSDGEETLRPLDASNVRVTDLNLDDDRREQRLNQNENQSENGDES